MVFSGVKRFIKTYWWLFSVNASTTKKGILCIAVTWPRTGIWPHPRYIGKYRRLIYNLICIPLCRILADSCLRSFKNSSSIFTAHKRPYILKYDPVNRHSSTGFLFWEKSIKGNYINGLPMHAERAHYGVCRKKCFISYVRI